MHINIKLIEEEVQMDAACLVGIAEVKRRMLQQLPDILNVPRNVWHGLEGEPFVYDLA